jgi:hypothetical protein
MSVSVSVSALRRLRLLLLLLASAATARAWSHWNYSFFTGGSYELWREQWSKAESPDKNLAPRPRRGHSLVLAGDYLVMFGGRGNEGEQVHIPRTYNVEKVRRA